MIYDCFKHVSDRMVSFYFWDCMQPLVNCPIPYLLGGEIMNVKNY